MRYIQIGFIATGRGLNYFAAVREVTSRGLVVRPTKGGGKIMKPLDEKKTK